MGSVSSEEAPLLFYWTDFLACPGIRWQCNEALLALAWHEGNEVGNDCNRSHSNHSDIERNLGHQKEKERAVHCP